ncbi:MAG: glutamate racemase [Saprospiraceae bacterium]
MDTSKKHLNNRTIEQSNNSIGVFDSGLGGLSVWLELVKLMPNEKIIYFADSGNCPYGNRPKSEIIDLSIRNTEFLLSKGAKIIVIACNTATGVAIKELRKRFDVPFIGMEPAVKPAAEQTKTKNIGVLATKGTLESEKFKNTKNAYAKGITVYMQVGQGLVEAVENQEIETEKTAKLVQQYVQPMLENDVDKIVLGCTHYPFLRPVFDQLLPQNVNLVNPAPAVARQTLKQLEKFSLRTSNTSEPKYEFHTSGNEKILERFLEYIGISSKRI